MGFPPPHANAAVAAVDHDTTKLGVGAEPMASSHRKPARQVAWNLESIFCTQDKMEKTIVCYIFETLSKAPTKRENTWKYSGHILSCTFQLSKYVQMVWEYNSTNSLWCRGIFGEKQLNLQPETLGSTWHRPSFQAEMHPAQGAQLPHHYPIVQSAFEHFTSSLAPKNDDLWWFWPTWMNQQNLWCDKLREDGQTVYLTSKHSNESIIIHQCNVHPSK